MLAGLLWLKLFIKMYVLLVTEIIEMNVLWTPKPMLSDAIINTYD